MPKKGYIYDGTQWVQVSSPPARPQTVYYQDTPPTGTFNTGDTWVDSNDNTTVTANGVPTSAFTANGDLLVGSGSGTYGSLPVGTANEVLSSDGSTARWGTIPYYTTEYASAWSGTASNSVVLYPLSRQKMQNVNGYYLLGQQGGNGSSTFATGFLYVSSLSATSQTTVTTSTAGYFTPTLTTLVYLPSASLYISARTQNTGTIVIETSPTINGSTWTSRTHPLTSLRTICASDTVAFASGSVSANGMATSTDGTTWTSRTWAFSTETLENVVFVNGYFIATTTTADQVTKQLYTSTDAITWTKNSSTVMTVNYSSSSDTSSKVSYGNGVYIFVSTGFASGTIFIATATNPTGTWTAKTVKKGSIFDTVGSAHDTASLAYNSSLSTWYVSSSSDNVTSTGTNQIRFAMWVSTDNGETWVPARGDWDGARDITVIHDLISDGTDTYAVVGKYLSANPLTSQTTQIAKINSILIAR